MIKRRPTKYMTACVSMLREAMERGVGSQCYTDKDAMFRMNDQLFPYGQKVCYRTFQRYKAAAIAFGEMEVEEQETFDPIFQDLYNTIQRAQLDIKENLYCALLQAEGAAWHSYKWIMERKFPDFNLRKVNEMCLLEAKMEQLLLEYDLAAMGLSMNGETKQQLQDKLETQLQATPQQPVMKVMEAPQQPANTGTDVEELEADIDEEEEDMYVPPKITKTPQEIKDFDEHMDRLEMIMDPEKVDRMRKDWHFKWRTKKG